MDKRTSSFLFSFSLGIFLLLLPISQATDEDKTQPRKNVNLSPFQSWRSAYFCLQNTTGSTCSTIETLQLNGTLYVQQDQMDKYCWSECYNRTLAVMDCIKDVKRDFIFGNKATVDFVKKVMYESCISHKGINITKDPNSATSLYGRLHMPFVSTLMTMAFLATFTV